MSQSLETLHPDARNIYDHAPVGFLTTDTAGTVLLINRTLLSWLGRDEAELLGKSWFDVMLTRVGRAFLDTHALPLLNLRHEIHDLIMDLVHADGTAEGEGGERIFCVSDNGVGFDADRAQDLFQPFKRMPSGKEFPGIGIGLATVRRIIERHRGRVFVRSKPGQGAHFYFALPKE